MEFDFHKEAERLLLFCLQNKKPILISGLPGTGKVYWSRKILDENKISYLYLVGNKANLSDIKRTLPEFKSENIYLDIEEGEVINEVLPLIGEYTGNFISVMHTNEVSKIEPNIINRFVRINFNVN